MKKIDGSERPAPGSGPSSRMKIISEPGLGLDPTLDALFQSSLVDSQRIPKRHPEPDNSGSSSTRRAAVTASRSRRKIGEVDEADVGYVNDSAQDFPDERLRKRRKRKDDNDNIEGEYLRRLTREQEPVESKAREQHIGQATQHRETQQEEDHQDTAQSDVEPASSEAEEDGDHAIPQHETSLTSGADQELQKANRTVFLSNVATAAMTSKSSRRQLLQHLSSFFDDIDSKDSKPKIESFRFRSTAYSSTAIPKKAAYARKEVMEATAKSTNAYVVYSTSQAAREAVRRLNSSVVLERHLRVDSVSHPSPVDNRRCVFVGNLGFVDDDSLIKAAEAVEEAKAKKKKQPGDVEEGLWRQFMKAGAVESVRVVRDKETRVGKGIAYVQFKDQIAVEKALAFNDKRFPPLLPRTLRVTRAKNLSKTSSQIRKSTKAEPRPGRIYNPRKSTDELSQAGRATKLFGKSASLAFEGNRARKGQGSNLGKLPSKRTGKPQTRSSRRGAAFKAAKKQSSS